MRRLIDITDYFVFHLFIHKISIISILLLYKYKLIEITKYILSFYSVNELILKDFNLPIFSLFILNIFEYYFISTNIKY